MLYYLPHTYPKSMLLTITLPGNKLFFFNYKGKNILVCEFTLSIILSL